MDKELHEQQLEQTNDANSAWRDSAAAYQLVDLLEQSYGGEEKSQ